jgi:glycerol-3-phosphate acyltransferase PlsY
VTLARTGLVAASYFLGSIPTGYWLGLAWKGVDVRQHGSGNLGATNVLRVLGTGAGVLTLALDILKGLIPVLISERLFPHELTLAILTGLAAILGHTASIFVRFRGGKGVATAAGVFVALLPVPMLAAVVVFAVVFGWSRYVSLGSLLAAVTLASSSWIVSAPPPLIWTTVAVVAFVFWTHRTNIQRLLKGTEHRIEWHKKNA